MTEKTLCQGAVEYQGDLCDVSVHRMIGRAERGAYIHHPGKSRMVPAEYLGRLLGQQPSGGLTRPTSALEDGMTSV